MQIKRVDILSFLVILLIWVVCFLFFDTIRFEKNQKVKTAQETRRNEIKNYRDQIVHSFKIVIIKKYKTKKEKTPTKLIYKSIIKWSEEFKLDPNMVIGLIIQESNFYTKARSSKDCRGLGQISRGALEDFNEKYLKKRSRPEYSFEEMFEYDKNIEVACWYLRFLLDNLTTFKLDKDDVLIAYNTGPRNVGKYKKDPNYKYKKNIQVYANEFSRLDCMLMSFLD